MSNRFKANRKIKLALLLYVGLPSDAEWEKAARGDQDERAYPWVDAFDATKCNCYECRELFRAT